MLALTQMIFLAQYIAFFVCYPRKLNDVDKLSQVLR